MSLTIDAARRWWMGICQEAETRDVTDEICSFDRELGYAALTRQDVGLTDGDVDQVHKKGLKAGATALWNAATKRAEQSWIKDRERIIRYIQQMDTCLQRAGLLRKDIGVSNEAVSALLQE